LCGRFTLAQDPDDLIARFGVSGSLFGSESLLGPLEPRYNIAPTQMIAAITGHGPDCERFLEPFQWGLVPFWSRDTSYASKLINARAETVAEKPSFKHALARRRCLVLADGFYEWDRVTKQPYHFRLKNQEPFAMAGLFEEWSSPDGSVLRSCSVITTEANGVLAPHHERMPVIFSSVDLEAIWLDVARFKASDVVPLLLPLDDAAMEKVAVSKRVGSVASDDAELIKAL
jgi:putative SOS response-associated peptidase YedK